MICLRWGWATGRVRLVALFFAGLALGACEDTAKKEPEIRPVRTVVVDPKPIEDDRRAVGEIKPRAETDFSFRVSGKLVSRPVDIGVVVGKDDVLARIDDQDYRNKLKSAEADVGSAQAVLTDAQSAEQRQKLLLDQGTTTRVAYDTAVKNLRSAQAQLDAANAAAELARDQLRYAELRADFAGIVTAVGAEPGQVINVGQMIVRLAPPDQKDAVFSIAESAFREQRETLPAVEVSLLSNPDISVEGVVREISPVADPTTRTFQVKVTLQDPPQIMRFGSSVLGRLKAETAPVVVLPSGALFDQNEKPAVWVFDPQTATVSLKPVSVDRYETDRIIISEGLKKGDIVVTAGVNRLREGQKVKLLEEASR